MNILVIGSGGREHALVWKIAQSRLVNKIFCAPGNPGIAELAATIDISPDDFAGLADFALKNKIDLTVVGPEDPLVNGIVDFFLEKGLKIFGPSARAARLEGSKVFAKNIMREAQIPTAEFFASNHYQDAWEYIQNYLDFPVVLKASGLAAGKGVLICANRDEALQALDSIMKDKTFGAAGNDVVIEEFLEGEEISVFAICDGKNYKLLASSQDHKRALDGDMGLNTGGMGAYAPAPAATEDIIRETESGVIQPLLSIMNKKGMPYKGLLYAGLIMTKRGIKVLEFNCRFGDPETEVVLPLLETDLVLLMLSSIEQTLDRQSVKNHKKYAIDVVLASGGYPEKYEKGKSIQGLNDLAPDTLVFHAGTKTQNGSVITSGGRVLNIVCLAENFMQARQKVYEEIRKIHFEKMHYRGDIGYRALKYF